LANSAGERYLTPSQNAYKIIIAGPFGSGKSQFVRTVSEIDVVATERRITNEEQRIKSDTTVAMDYGRSSLDGRILHIFGTPGQARFEFMWEILADEMDGFVILIESTRPEMMNQAQQLIDLFTRISPAPFVVAVNKQDLVGAVRPDHVRDALKLSTHIPVLPCIATDRDSAFHVLKELGQAIQSVS
jgi:signal recognition particle receptor subunit beta